jgi:multidrug efflux pump subunit AcrA (membrane-fusion protein)
MWKCFLKGVIEMKKMNWKLIGLVAVLAVALGVYSIAFADTVLKPTATLSGVVAADGLVQAGTTVTEGQVLVQVKTVAGLMPAARANGSGKVTAVYVSAGQNITSGQEVAAISVSK